ncbi:phosphatidic acid phosphatase type 2/haloperoxidase [Endogone sp. FLAS-F59071]|nr:phosphatidic acid phosphatase type 2/haloperoxidase [Endogone sp. FLAS-F59071]|eukprot:RUS18341.1 phosphatidic acid phosphatase type 2/haloperoxidase [Endogone sp. FLAS-F59071]
MPFSDPRTKALILSYVKDWIIVIILTVGFLSIDFVEPFHRQFSLTDQGLFHPYAVHERVPTYLLVIISSIIPLVIITFISLGIRRSLFDLHNGILGLLLSLSLTIMVTEVVKISIGMPRPDFIDRCRPYPGAVDPPYGLSNGSVCTQTDKAMMTDGFKSFPSGHSSMSFAGLTYLSLFLAGKLHIFDQRGHTYKSFIFVLPMVLATYIATTRLEDYRHRPLDVTAGGAVGIVFAFFAYRQYYPPLSHPQSHKPYSPRIPRLDSDDIRPIQHGLTADFDLNNDSSRESVASPDLEAIRVE